MHIHVGIYENIHLAVNMSMCLLKAIDIQNMFIGFCAWFLFCYAVHCVISRFAIKRELVALL